MITLRGSTYKQSDYEAIAEFLQEAFHNIIVPDCRGIDDLCNLMHYCFNKVVEIDEKGGDDND